MRAADEFPHDDGGEATYNESMYVNGFDSGQGVGAWFRVGNRVNEGYAEVSVCVYLDDGRVGFSYQRPEISSNEAMAGAGLAIEVVEPFERLRATYDGPLLLLDDPREMVDPRAAFAANPLVDASFELDLLGVSPVHGGVGDEHSPLAGFATAHYEQHIAVTGPLRVGDVEVELDGLGLRDKSWGPRTWQAVSWYRWLPMTFAPGFAAAVTVLGTGEGEPLVAGVVLRDGAHEPIGHVDCRTTYDDDLHPVAVDVEITTEQDTYEVHGDVVSMIPLRNRRPDADGVPRTTRITESMTRWTCRGHSALGMAEHLDQLVDGHPVGIARP